MKQNIVVILVATLLFSSIGFSRTSLTLSRGTMQAGGAIKMPITIPKNSGARVGLHFAPSFDYFVAKSFSLGFSPTILRDSLTAEGLPWKFSLAARGVYYFDLGGAIYPYLGVSSGIAWATKVKGFNFSFGAPVGILVALNRTVAIDFGVPLEFEFNNDGYQAANLPIGFVGIRAFF